VSASVLLRNLRLVSEWKRSKSGCQKAWEKLWENELLIILKLQ
jgi:hypothetical protein